MRPDCELTTLMAAVRRALEGELKADVQAQFWLVVNASQPHLANLDDGEPAGPGYSQRPAVGCQDAPVRGDVAEVPFVGERHKLVLSTPIWGGYRVPGPVLASLAEEPGNSPRARARCRP